MSAKSTPIFCLALLALTGSILVAGPMGTAFTYQGRLADRGAPANGFYDLSFAVYNAYPGGTQIGPSLTNYAVAITGGVFSVSLDFSNVFDGNERWLEIGVRTNGTSNFTTLWPRFALTSAPYALYSLTAGTAGAAGTAATLSGTLSGDVTGTQSATVVGKVGGQTAASIAGGVNLANAATPANTVGAIVKRDGAGGFAAGNVSASGFQGDGGGLVNLPAEQLTGTVADVRLPATAARTNQVWLRTGNSGTDPLTDILGTTDGEPLAMRASGGLRLESTPGILLNALDMPLITRGWDAFTSGKYAGLGRWGLFMEPSLLTLGFAALDNRGLQFVRYYEDSTYTSLLKLDVNGNVAIDPNDQNNDGVYPGLTFGSYSGEGFASKRTAGGNQYGLDLYTGFQKRITVLQNGNVGIGETAPGAKLQVAGDLMLTGQYRGNIGPNNGAPFPRPAYDSGWVAISSDITLTHNVGGNTDNYVVDLQIRNDTGVPPYTAGVYQSYYVERPQSDNLSVLLTYGAYWRNLTPTTVRIKWGQYNFLSSFVRLRIWMYN